MNISSVSSLSSAVSSLGSSAIGSGHRPGGGKSPFDAVSSTLGMSADDIASQVSSGKSLDDIAKSKGVSHSDLVAALKAGMPDEMKNSADADKIAETIATQQGMPTRGAGDHDGPPPGDGPGSGGGLSSLSSIGRSSGVISGNLTASQNTMLSGLSSLLGTDSSSLLDKLRSGTSLADLLKDKGVDSSALAGVLQNGLMVDTQA